MAKPMNLAVFSVTGVLAFGQNSSSGSALSQKRKMRRHPKESTLITGSHLFCHIHFNLPSE